VVYLDPSLTIAIDRTGMTPSTDLVLSGDDDSNVWGVLPGWQIPGKQPEIQLASSPRTHGGVVKQWKWLDGIMSGHLAATPDTPAELQEAIDELEAALGRSAYDITVTKNGIGRLWRCQPGTVNPSTIDYEQLAHNQHPYSISIPCYPIATAVV
jgi:hypothetical protein